MYFTLQFPYYRGFVPYSKDNFPLQLYSTKKEAFYSIKEDKDEQKEFETGPLSVLMQSVQQNTQVSWIEFH